MNDWSTLEWIGYSWLALVFALGVISFARWEMRQIRKVADQFYPWQQQWRWWIQFKRGKGGSWIPEHFETNEGLIRSNENQHRWLTLGEEEWGKE